MFDLEQYNPKDFNATYSPEDNKLRLYADVRLAQPDWKVMKINGWKWAPKQELFVCYWSVGNEDFCLKLAGDILPEEMTMVERAELKADRLLKLAHKRSDQCVGYQQAANNLMLRLDQNQPILSGHHSQRKAEKTQLQVTRNIEKAEETAQAVGYWVWRSKGVICHANHKNSTRTISNRIQTLLKQLRTYQRIINEAAHYLDLIVRVEACLTNDKPNPMLERLLGCYYFGNVLKDESNSTTLEKLELMSKVCEATINSKVRGRKISHILNRLAYEQDQLSLVPLFDGVFTPGIIQTFLRTHGADKPKATKSEYGYIAESDVCFPLHIGSGLTLELTDQEWRELMQSVGYEVPAKRVAAAKPPILNFKTTSTFTWERGYSTRELVQVELTKEAYKAVGKDHCCTGLSKCGTFRFRIGFIKTGVDKWGSNDYTWCAVFITDSKAHPVPESIKTA